LNKQSDTIREQSKYSQSQSNNDNINKNKLIKRSSSIS